jgi:sporulation protein YlmC with PRC-barrel domain
MLLLSEAVINKPVLSLRTGGVVALMESAIINPANLKIEGLYCQDRISKNKLILLYQDIRNVVSQGAIVNDYDVLSSPDILVRLQDVLKLKFSLVGKSVYTVQKEKVGKVKDFAFDSDTFFVQKLYVGRSLTKSFSGGQLSIDRNQVVEVTTNKIIIQDILKPVDARSAVSAPSPVGT